MTSATGLIVELNGYRYEFATAEDAESFATCIDTGTSTDTCATQSNCIRKVRIESDYDFDM